MCGRIMVDYERLEDYLRAGSMAGEAPALARWFAESESQAASSWNVKPTERIPAAFTRADGHKTHAQAHWSLVPAYAPSPNLKYPTFNARSETAADKPTFRNAVRRSRCIVPVTGFYEWTGQPGARVPYAIFGPEPVLCLAGLLEWWQPPESSAQAEDSLPTVTILTTAATGAMTAIHDRMPVFVRDGDVAEWLHPNTVGNASLLHSFAMRATQISEKLKMHEVAPLRGNGSQLCEPRVNVKQPTLW